MIPSGTALPNVANSIRYAVDKAGWSLGMAHGMIGARDEEVLVRLDRDPFAQGTPIRSFPANWRERLR